MHTNQILFVASNLSEAKRSCSNFNLLKNTLSINSLQITNFYGCPAQEHQKEHILCGFKNTLRFHAVEDLQRWGTVTTASVLKDTENCRTAASGLRAFKRWEKSPTIKINHPKGLDRRQPCFFSWAHTENMDTCVKDKCRHRYQHSPLKEWKWNAGKKPKRVRVGQCHPFGMIHR